MRHGLWLPLMQHGLSALYAEPKLNAQLGAAVDRLRRRQSTGVTQQLMPPTRPGQHRGVVRKANAEITTPVTAVGQVGRSSGRCCCGSNLGRRGGWAYGRGASC